MLNGFGSRTGDFCRVATIGGVIVGAAWSRLGCSYGKVDASIPELAISLGRRLLESLLNSLCENGYKKVSLSVDKTNYAVSMYRNLGFETIVEREHDYLMVKHLNRK
ncbi:GNAT family N-acetyltransferase [Muribaculum intestinale]|uniref:GNAT family N-acetyltransferase n=1 Tax=Muribaculum intestinale TaxID=1796646 RepID=UPI001F02B27F|nr:GNAT family N-acetyltransferase [Muribaculum intestinale]